MTKEQTEAAAAAEKILYNGIKNNKQKSNVGEKRN